MQKAVAIDFGAGSGRYALGELQEDGIHFTVVRQVPHGPRSENGRLVWDIDAMLLLCREATDYAESVGAESIGIDTWGVDHGFLDKQGQLAQPPVCYRDESHVRAFEELAPHRRDLYRWTGIQHQPFNTDCQLLARKTEDASLPERCSWLLLPDLLASLLGADAQFEATNASTTQLCAPNGVWSREAFELIGWPVPDLQPSPPATLSKIPGRKVGLARVGSHDTASAVAGFGRLNQDDQFINVGTWSLSGCVMERPIVTREAENAGFTNERTVDGKIRFLQNIPGFYVISRLHEELRVASPIPAWLESVGSKCGRSVDVMEQALFNPASMVDVFVERLGFVPATHAEWADIALGSLVRACAASRDLLQKVTGRTVARIRVGGGGSGSQAFCSRLASVTGVPVVAGPAEATLIGNLLAQFIANGRLRGWADAFDAASQVADRRIYDPISA